MKKLFALFFLFAGMSAFAAAEVADMDVAVKSAEKKAGSNIIMSAKLDMYGNTLVYDIEIFKQKNLKLKYKLNALDLSVVDEYEEKIHDNKANILSLTKINYKDAVATALKKVEGGALIEFDLETKNGKPYYEIKAADAKGLEVEIYVDAVNGELAYYKQKDVLLNEPETSLESAKAKALETINGKVLSAVLDSNHGVWNYEVKILSNDNKLYEVKISGKSGSVIKYKQED